MVTSENSTAQGTPLTVISVTGGGISGVKDVAMQFVEAAIVHQRWPAYAGDGGGDANGGVASLLRTWFVSSAGGGEQDPTERGSVVEHPSKRTAEVVAVRAPAGGAVHEEHPLGGGLLGDVKGFVSSLLHPVTTAVAADPDTLREAAATQPTDFARVLSDEEHKRNVMQQSRVALGVHSAAHDSFPSHAGDGRSGTDGGIFAGSSGSSGEDVRGGHVRTGAGAEATAADPNETPRVLSEEERAEVAAASRAALGVDDGGSSTGADAVAGDNRSSPAFGDPATGRPTLQPVGGGVTGHVSGGGGGGSSFHSFLAHGGDGGGGSGYVFAPAGVTPDGSIEYTTSAASPSATGGNTFSSAAHDAGSGGGHSNAHVVGQPVGQFLRKGEQVSEDTAGVVEALREGAEAAVGGMKKAAHDMAVRLESAVAKAFNGAQDSAEEAGAAAEQGVTGAWDAAIATENAVERQAAQAVEHTSDAAHSAAERVKRATSSAADGVRDAVDGAGRSMERGRDRFGDVAEQAGKAMSGAEDQVRVGSEEALGLQKEAEEDARAALDDARAEMKGVVEDVKVFVSEVVGKGGETAPDTVHADFTASTQELLGGVVRSRE